MPSRCFLAVAARLSTTEVLHAMVYSRARPAATAASAEAVRCRFARVRRAALAMRNRPQNTSSCRLSFCNWPAHN